MSKKEDSDDEPRTNPTLLMITSKKKEVPNLRAPLTGPGPTPTAPSKKADPPSSKRPDGGTGSTAAARGAGGTASSPPAPMTAQSQAPDMRSVQKGTGGVAKAGKTGSTESNKDKASVIKKSLFTGTDHGAPLIIGKDHTHSRQERRAKATTKILLWGAVFLLSVMAFTYAMNQEDGVGNMTAKDKLLDYGLFFIMLFIVARFLTTVAAAILIVSVAAFHYWENLHYKERPPIGLSGHHARYFMGMFVMCFICLRGIGLLRRPRRKRH